MSKDETETAEAPKKSSKNLVIMILAAVLLIGGGAGAYLTLFSGKAEAAEEKPEPGEVVTLDAITINLADGHYLKLGMALQASADVEEPPSGAKALDLAIEAYTGVKVAELSSTKGRDHAKAELLEKVKHAYENEVYDIYFTQFVTQ